MSNDADLPDVFQAEWSLDQVGTLFEDLQAGAEIHHVQVRVDTPGRPSDQAVTLGQAKQLLDEGKVTAMQIRYRFEGQDWCDTLMVRAGSIRIIRTSNASL